MTRKQHEMKYIKLGLYDYQLKTLDNLLQIYNFDVRKLSGYSLLSDENRELFNNTILRFYNAHGLDSRLSLSPKSVNYVEEITYFKFVCDSEDRYFEDVAVFTNIVDRSGNIHEYKKDIFCDAQLSECGKRSYFYLRFELENEFYHFIDGYWY